MHSAWSDIGETIRKLPLQIVESWAIRWRAEDPDNAMPSAARLQIIVPPLASFLVLSQPPCVLGLGYHQSCGLF